MLVLAPWLYADLSSGAASSLQFQEARVLSRGNSRGLLAVPIFFGGILLALGPAGGAMLFTSRKMHPLSFAALLLLAACFVPVLKGGGELNWSMPALIFALPALKTRFERAARGVALASAAVLAVLLVHVAYPFLPIPAKNDTTRRGAGFAEVARSAKALADQTGAHLIITRRYQLASMMRYHMGDALPVLELGSARRSQYDVWPKPELRPGETALLVLGSPDLPAGIDLERLEPSEEVIRKSGNDVLEALYLTPVRKRGPS
jgi:hypothetical protein